jgi:transglutaminase-like putative cysteine protease
VPMLRRNFLKTLAATGTLAAVGKSALAVPPGWRQFEITYQVTLQSQKTPARVWIPVPQDALDYQRVLELSWRSPAAASLLWEPASRAPIISAAWSDPAMPREIEITARVATRDRTGYCPDASPKELADYLRPTPSSPTDGIVLAKSREIVGSRIVALDKARAIYDWIVDNTFRRAETRGCGLGNIAFMLESGDMGGKCADINSLYVGLARAAGLPARDFSVSASRTRPCRNLSENRAKLQRHSIAAPRCLSKAKDGCRLIRRTFERSFLKRNWPSIVRT